MIHNLALFICFLQFLSFGRSEILLGEAATFEQVELQIRSLKQLRDLYQNQRTFSLLQYSQNAFYDSARAVLGTLDFVQHHAYQTQPYVANGFFGARVPNLGHGFTYDLAPRTNTSLTEDLNNGWPIFNKRFAGAFVAGFFNSQKNTSGYNFPWLYQYGWDSVISAIPQWTSLSISTGGYILDPAQPSEIWGGVTNYVQNLSLENGVVSTLYTWLGKLHLQYDILANKHDINVGTVSLIVQNPTEDIITITVNDTIDFRTGQRCSFVSSEASRDEGIQMLVSPAGVSDVYGAMFSRLLFESGQTGVFRTKKNELDVSQAVETEIYPGESLKFTKMVGIHTSDVNPLVYDLPEKVLLKAKESVLNLNVERIRQNHNDAWKKTLGNSASVEFPDSPLLTMASKASVYHINANMRDNAHGLTSALSVSGLSSDSYGGQVFWDTDLWILMGIMSFNPLVSKSLLNYRIGGHAQAIENIQSPSKPKNTFAGAIYPWTSGRFGNCTATGPCFDYEYHINAAIAYSAIQLYLSGAVDDLYLENTIYPIVLDAALLFSSYLEYNETISQYTSKNLTDPDEFAEFVDNGAYTNAAMSMTIKWARIIAKHLGKTFPSTFTQILDHIHIPHSPDDENLVLEYTGMNSSIAVKQADVIMMTYPLENELITEELARENLMYYAARQVSTGPAMTFLIFSIVSSALLDTGCSSESYLLKSIVPFLRGPFAQFLEQSDDHYETNGGTHPAFPFLTAHGGFLQTILMGLLGMRFSYQLRDDKIERIITFQANSLSLFPNGVRFEEVKYMNTSLSILLDDSFLTVKNNGPIAQTIDTSTDIKVISNSLPGIRDTRILKRNETAIFSVLPRKQVHTESLTECGLALFDGLTAGAQGDVVDLMHDGDNSTYWQFESTGEAQVLIDLKERKSVRGGLVNWGDLPARLIQIFLPWRDADHSKRIIPKRGQQKIADPEQFTSVDSAMCPIQSLVEGDCIFRKVFVMDVQITEPFNPKESAKIEPIRRHNITKFEFSSPLECSSLLVKFIDSYSDQGVGAKVYDINFFEA
ncbi:alpha,alpha-trehalase [Metschnikowia aff. pulcherrima]|uniref:alpha,alpha-trehalase n=1 Tax=Metschnikowia aff. pulcherrima TaxID=2163413 RepID=A0A4P6XRN1_9ASCO|nr:alpha,alpha-trehalase [Metschnikowia aff. pulcherrima]